MKKLIAVTGLVLSISGIYAQEPLDAIRYSWKTSQGTARAQAIGGATTALGGDITSLYSNPAGLGIYKTGELVFTPGISFSNDKSNYRGGSATDSKSSFNFGPIGLVYGIPSRGYSKWKNTTIALGLSKADNFNNRVYVDGTNNQSSYSEKYLEQLINNRVLDPNEAANNYPYGASLALNTYLIDPTYDNNNNVTGYASNASVSTGLRQQQMINSKGGITDFNIGLASNYNDVFYIGGAVSFNSLRFVRNTTFTESDATNDTNNDFNYFTAADYLRTEGVGVGINLGIMARPVEALRVGLSFHSPSWYSMKDTYTSALTTDTEGYKGVKSQSSTDFNDGYAGEYNYRYRTPMRLALGLAYMFGTTGDVKTQNGFITADVEYVNYKQNTFNTQGNDATSGDKDYFTRLNKSIDQSFKNALNLRVGGELKFETFMVRAGFAYYGNPYTNNYFGNRAQDITNASKMNITGGLGWRAKGMFVDLAYIHQIVKDAYYPYTLEDNVYNIAKLNRTVGNVLLTVGFKF